MLQALGRLQAQGGLQAQPRLQAILITLCEFTQTILTSDLSPRQLYIHFIYPTGNP